MKSRLIILLFAAISLYIFFNRDQQDHNQISSDKCGYYLYLPATFIYHDLSRFLFYDSIKSAYQTGFELKPVGDHMLDKYPIGVALLELPFFIIADVYCKIGDLKRDGFSLPYQIAMLFSNIFWVATGLFIIRAFLRSFFNENVITVTLFCISFGTNLYVYTAFDIGMSHSYSFFLFACLVQLTNMLYKNSYIGRQPLLHIALLGCVLGLIFVVRPINIVALLIPLLWKIADAKQFKKRLSLIAHYLMAIITFIFFLSVPFILQSFYWKYVTGHWLFYSYTGEHFDFLRPHIINGLFSYRKGWFVYTPITLLCFMGFYSLRKIDRSLIPGLTVFFVTIIYCVFSWQEWWYGGSFGCRPLIETIAILSLPLAAIINSFYTTKKGIKKASFFSLLSFLVVLNLFQSYQYNMGIIHWDRMTRESYWRAFGKIKFDHVENEKYLIKTEDENKLNQ